jgi:hypothetical protein
MHVADHALAGRDGVGQDVAHRMARLILRNRGIGGFRRAAIRMGIVKFGRGMHRRAVVGVGGVTRRAAAGTVVAGMVVGAHQGGQRIEQARLLQSQEHRVGTQHRPKPARAELDFGQTGQIGFREGVAHFRLLPAPALEDAQDVARLRDFPPGQRRDERDDAAILPFGRRWRLEGHQRLGRAVLVVAFPPPGVFVGVRAIVVERRSPQHRPCVIMLVLTLSTMNACPSSRASLL